MVMLNFAQSNKPAKNINTLAKCKVLFPFWDGGSPNK
jgi:hypothetical protein